MWLLRDIKKISNKKAKLKLYVLLVGLSRNYNVLINIVFSFFFIKHELNTIER